MGEGCIVIDQAAYDEKCAELRRVRAERDEASKLLADLLDPAMPAALPGAVAYLIDHSNAGWTEVARLRAREARADRIERLALECVTALAFAGHADFPPAVTLRAAIESKP